MSANVRRSTLIFGLALTGFLIGCHSTTKPVDHFESGGAKGTVAVVASDLVVLDLPTVTVKGGITTVTGNVHRQPAVQGPLPGRVNIEFLSADGEYLDGLPVPLTPRSVPTDPSVPASYTTSYGYVPPVGATIRVHFVDHDTAVREDIEGSDFSYGGGTGAGAGSGPAGKGGLGAIRNSNGTHSVNNGGATRMPFGSNFGKH